MQRGRSPVSLTDLILARLLQPGQTLSFRGQASPLGSLTAAGKIVLDGREYSSPSTAARAAAGGTSTNGWLAWQVEEGGQYTPLAALRSRYLAG
jgi:hypothetical protein